jgi:hypothetical protein
MSATAQPEERIADLERRMDTVEKAFPGNDPESHRRYHEMMIEEARDRKALTKAIKEKTIAGLVWSGLFVLGIAIWQYLVAQVRRGG